MVIVIKFYHYWGLVVLVVMMVVVGLDGVRQPGIV